MATQHTPGPWKFEPHGAYASDFLGEDWPLGYISQASPPVPIFALGPILEYPTDQLLANGRLIAAAPDLLDALVEAEKHFGPFADITINGEHDADDVRVVAQIRAALAKIGTPA